ncbi:hypothetical protein EDD36DRAFT_44232 [Exophiala viscosa]|uniref:Uncharacterized protein n=1 Tax=Exophiala viscosa TaxID=2486360 RepID=A0AAN6E6K5_9EURO|nr:hypothetical protein EDD36DRAFT_44232 [Exophiala viscosa]
MSSFSTNDLRSSAKPYQRDKTHNTKWSRGAKGNSTQPCIQHDYPMANCTKCLGRPKGQDIAKGEARYKQNHKTRLSGQAATLARKVFRNEVVDAMDGPLANVSDNSEEDEVADTSAAPLPVEADYLYSYDAHTGPRAGTYVLSYAVTQAVRRFENTETEKLVKKEYDVVDGKDMADLSTDEDDFDFEMIDHSHLN